MDGDKIMLLGNILDPAIPVWRLRIARNQELVIEREVQAKALPYLCSGNCCEFILTTFSLRVWKHCPFERTG